eukprot:scaffold8365_cov22-Tisochrysis_lutea.AAC.1
MLRVRMECKDQPCLVEFELWQQHAILAPACGVLLLPGSMSGVAEELNAWVQPLWDFKHVWGCREAECVGAASIGLQGSLRFQGSAWLQPLWEFKAGKRKEILSSSKKGPKVKRAPGAFTSMGMKLRIEPAVV